jgi:hypothetical protein
LGKSGSGWLLKGEFAWVGTVTGTGSLATAYGVWEKDGEYYVYSPFLGFGLLAQSWRWRR